MADLPHLLGRELDRRKPCPACGSVLFRVEPGCGRGGLWLGLAEAERLNAQHAPIEPPVEHVPAFLMRAG